MKLKLELEIINSGELDAIAMWFDLHLDDSITITTAPDTVNCWEQAIFPMQPVHFACKCKRDYCSGMFLHLTFISVVFNIDVDKLRFLIYIFLKGRKILK